MKKLLLFIGAVAAMTACAESSTAPTAPAQKRAPSAVSHDFTCRSGYAIAYDSNGNPYCVPDSSQTQQQAATRKP